MDRIGVREFGRADDARNVQVAVRTLGRTNTYGLISEPHVKRMPVGLGKNSNGLDTQLFTREDDPKGDFSAICDKYFLEHVYRWRIAKSFSPYSTGWPSSTRIRMTSPVTSDSISFINFIASIMQTTVPFSTKSPTDTNGSEIGRASCKERGDIK